MHYDHDDLLRIACNTADAYRINRQLVCAVVEQESNWDTYAFRAEPAFLDHYIAPLLLEPTESWGRSISWGLLQVMGQVAYEFGFARVYTMLTDPYIGLDTGCKVLKHKLSLHPGDVSAGLLAYNGGANKLYADQVLARIANYQAQAKTETI